MSNDFNPLDNVAELIVSLGEGDIQQTAAVLSGVLDTGALLAEHGSELRRNDDISILGLSALAAHAAAHVMQADTDGLPDEMIEAEDIAEILRAMFTAAPLGQEEEE